MIRHRSLFTFHSSRGFFVGFGVDSERGVHALRVLFALRFEPFENVVVNRKSYGIGRRPKLRVLEKLIIQRRDVGRVNFIVRHRPQSFPIRS